MEKWEIAVEKFLKKWQNKKEVVGAVVCGSYITGNPSKHSDIDIHILLDKQIIWRERGNEYIDGFLIEYFANPLSQNLKYFEDDYSSRRKMNLHMFKTGRIIFDKNGDVKKLIETAKKWDKKEYKKLPQVSKEISKYFLWDMNDNLEEVFEANGEEFYLVYYVQLEKLFDSYAAYLCYDNIAVYKIKRFLTNNKDKIKYYVKEFPDLVFLKLYVNAITLNDKNKMMKEYQKLTKYVLDKMDGFNIDGWKIRSSVEK